MIELILVRHAKSDWGNPSLSDHDRPLNVRGRANALMMAERFASEWAKTQQADGGAPKLAILSSTAVRARSTAEEFARALGLTVEIDPELYMSTAKTLMREAVASGAPAVLFVAHDPGITVLAHDLSEGGIELMPTGAIARFVWEDADDWTAVTDVPPSSWSFDAPRS